VAAKPITKISDLPPAIDSEQEVAIPGYYLGQGDKHDRWLLRRTRDGKPVAVVRIRWSGLWPVAKKVK
jgi:hypothetical protein